MPRLPKLARSQSYNATSTIASGPLLLPNTCRPQLRPASAPCTGLSHPERPSLATFFFSALSHAAACKRHKEPRPYLQRERRQAEGSHKSIRDARYIHTARHAGWAIDKQLLQTSPSQLQVSGRATRSVHYPSKKRRDEQSQRSDQHGFFDSTSHDFARGSNLPTGFYEDLEKVAGVKFDTATTHAPSTEVDHTPAPSASLDDQVGLLKTVRELEEKLSKARSALQSSLTTRSAPVEQTTVVKEDRPVVLSKQDYLNLVDLYYYSHQARFEPDSPDYSPSPLFLDDYSFELSRDFSEPTGDSSDVDEEDISLLKEVEDMLKSRQLREVSLMQAFVNLLLDEKSSNRALFEVYKMLPDPGVAYLPKGVLRVFLQRMSTPRQKAEKPMLRYLSLIDDMQKAKLRITVSEWSSAIYLAGRSFKKVTEGSVAKSFGIWRAMEQEAGVKANHVTFNILFDIAVRAEKHGLAQMILKEMHGRGLRLNRLGRVSLIYYHGVRGDGDAVRRTYRDFVEAGEIVDTLVLNCVMASLIRAQEPAAAEQIYERMKQLQTRLRSDVSEDGEATLFMKYPPPGPTHLDSQMASNHLGRVLTKSAQLRKVLPEHHMQLQASMPLTPDQITYRSMLSYHAMTSGNLDRIVVLINDKTDLIGLSLTSLDFQLLFKGFAVHGAARGEQKWNCDRLDMLWKACTELINDGLREQPASEAGVEIPTIDTLDARLIAPADLSSSSLATKPDAWEEFILDLAAFPRERVKKPLPLSDDVYPEDADPEGAAQTLDFDKGMDYALPAANHIFQHRRSTVMDSNNVTMTRNLAIWLIRAYARCTRSRRSIEDVWFQVHKLWRPLSEIERDAVVKVLRRALRDCDTHGTMDS